jgi:hypothetical protein
MQVAPHAKAIVGIGRNLYQVMVIDRMRALGGGGREKPTPSFCRK